MNSRFSLIYLSQSILFNILVLAAYFIFGLLGLELAVPPSNAGAVWPPAGIALASVLLLGRRIVPGIFIGNFCISAWAFGFNSESMLLYLANGIGATTGALTGAHLIVRFVGFPSALLEDRPIILFLVLGGPFSCLIPATVGISAMAANGFITADEIPINWFSWWVGDSVGVLVFTPLLLTLFAAPKALWRQRFIPVGMPLILSFLLVTFFFSYIQKIEQLRHEQEFETQSLILSEALKHRIQSHIQGIYGIRNLLIGIPNIERNDFKLFTQPALRDYAELESVMWQIYRPGHQREIELKMQFAEQKTNAPLSLPPLSERQLEQLAEVDDTDRMTKTQIESVNDKLIFRVPVYQKTSANEKRLSGIVSTTISVPKLIDQAFKTLNHEGIYLAITEADADTGYSIIYSNTLTRLHGNYRQHPLNVGDQVWQLYYYQDPVLAHSRTHWSVWWFLIGGLLFTSLLGMGLLLLTGRYFKTEQIVSERTADLLHAKNAAEAANRTKDHFLAKISHELRTPLNGIMGFTQLLQKNSGLSDIEKHHVDIISRCSEDLLTLINDILDIAAIENNKIKITIEKFDCNAFLKDITELFKLKAKEKKLNFVTTIKGVPPYLYGDKKRIRQILSNLLNNAIKYTDQGQVALVIDYHDGLLKFTVSDTGCGISCDHLNLIFSPFIQISDNGIAKEGIGIGLAICKELIKLMKGDITVQSGLGIGSEFTVTLPISCDDTDAVVSTDEKYGDRNYENSKVKVLIADDNEINLLLLTNLLDKQHCSIDSALNGKEAFNLINRNQYHLAFVDLNMPVIDGIQLVKRLRRQHNSLTMIAISAYADEQMIQKALEAGFDHYLTKPVDFHQLNRLILKYTKHHD